MTSVVIVDDQALNRRILERFARDVDTEVDVRTFASPLEALAAIAEFTPDLIVTDYVMPGLSG
ncbi:MAG TPA: response regulator, partial [Rhodospirillales bacterium]|nr:response regulator [Rhodospirillales bacterium]